MNNNILSGNACFLVNFEDDEKIKSNFIDYLKNEGFRETISTYNTSHSHWLFINVNSMVFGGGYWKPVKLTPTIVGEDPPNAFSISEFKSIWNILKKYLDLKRIESIDNSMVSCGNSSFLIKDDRLKISENFIDYLRIHKFESIDKFRDKWGYMLINVNSMLFTTSPHIISPYVGNLPDDALKIEEFKEIWEIIIRHKGKTWNIENYIDDCDLAYQREDYDKVIGITNKILGMDTNEKALEYKISSLYNLKRYREARNILEDALSIYPTNHNFLNTKAFILSDIYQTDEAIDCFNLSFKLGGFDGENMATVEENRAKCYLKKSREEYYRNNDRTEALKSLMVYLNRFPEDKNALQFKKELHEKEFRYDNQLLYFETKADTLFKQGFLKKSYETYRDVLKASNDFKKNIPNITCLGYDIVNRCSVNELDNFRWYDEILFKCLNDFKGDYHEFFEKLYEISDETIGACLDKAILYSKIYDEESTMKYTKKLIQKCPENKKVKEFYNKLVDIRDVYKVAETCDEFKDYNNIEEYIEDVIVCVVASFTYYDMESARREVEKSKDFIKESYEKKIPAGDVAWEFVIF